ncbi:MAG: ATP-binding protein [Verrucomicrobiales bacterium]|nr:ATP-binding protein [Verrucomicrobiales bacterium]
MSSTRRTTDPEYLQQGRYASDPDFVELRGIEATAALLKAKTVSTRERQLIFFLQSRSLEEGGLEALVEDIIALVPEHFRTPTMRRNPVESGGAYLGDVGSDIRRELEQASSIKECFSDEAYAQWKENEEDRGQAIDEVIEIHSRPGEWPRSAGKSALPSLPVESAIGDCLRRARAELPRMIVEVCVRPRLQVLPSGWKLSRRLRRGDEVCDIPYLRHLGWTLDVYWSRYVQRAREGFAQTSIAAVLQPALDYALETHRMVLIEGNSGVGKTESSKAWCDQNRHVARYLTLSGISNRTTLCRSLAHALGLPKSMALSATKILPRIEDFLRESRLMLVIDEAHYLWPQTNRPDRSPELINWLMTACSNRGVPVALITTADWDRLKGNTEKHTRWNSEQLGRRINRRLKLPDHPTEEDFSAVLRSVAKDVAPTAQDLLAAYGMGRGGSLTRMIDALEDARRVAAAAGRRSVTGKDVLAAVDARSLSDGALERSTPSRRAGHGRADGSAIPETPDPGGEARQRTVHAPVLQGGRSTAVSGPDQENSISLLSGRNRGSVRRTSPFAEPVAG